jgi:hypothetical protein
MQSGNNLYKDPRGALAAIIAILCVIGFVVLSVVGNSVDANELLTFAGIPVAFLLGFASDPK